MIWLNNTFLSSLSKRKSVSSHLRCDASLLFIWCFPRRQWFPPSQICIPLFRFLNFSIYLFMCVRACSIGIYRLFVSFVFPASKSVHFSLFPCAKVSVLIAIMYHRIEAATSFFSVVVQTGAAFKKGAAVVVSCAYIFLCIYLSLSRCLLHVFLCVLNTISFFFCVCICRPFFFLLLLCFVSGQS
jgi:hypothetical protein